MKKINFRQIKKFIVKHVLLLVLIIIVGVFAYYYFTKRSFRENAEPNTSCSQVNGDGTLEVSSSKNITEIRELQYQDCENIIRVKIPKNITKIGNNAFRKCKNLKYIEFEPKSTLKEIGDDAFAECNNLECIFLPQSLEIIRDRAFPYNTKGVKIYLENHSGDSGNYNVDEFGKIDWFMLSLNLDDSLMTDKNKFFVSPPVFDALKIKYQNDPSREKRNNLNFIAKIEKADYDIAKADNKTNMLVYEKKTGNPNCNNISNGTLIISETTLQIDDGKYVGCDNIIRVRIPKSVTKIGNCAFYNCKNLEYIVFDMSSNLKEIGSYAFSGCEKMERIFLPDSFPTIGCRAFPATQNGFEVYLEQYTSNASPSPELVNMKLYIDNFNLFNFFINPYSIRKDESQPVKFPKIFISAAVLQNLKETYGNNNEKKDYFKIIESIDKTKHDTAKETNDKKVIDYDTTKTSSNVNQPSDLNLSSDVNPPSIVNPPSNVKNPVSVKKTPEIKPATITAKQIYSIELNDKVKERLPKIITGDEIKSIKLK